MGGSESKPISEENNSMFNNMYNLIPSFPLKEYEKVYLTNYNKYITNNFDINKKYIDLRNECPPILDVQNIPLHPIASVCSIINYQLNKNKLPLFPPSILFIYYNCKFYGNINSILSYEIIFKSIEKYGFCSEIDFPYSIDNLHLKPSIKSYKNAEAFKFININRIENNLELIKRYLQAEQLILISIVLYCDLNNITDKLWIPDLRTDKRIGSTSGILVGYSDDRESFIVKMAYGKNFGTSGYITIPYKYILDIDLTPELYSLDLKKNRIEGFINQNRELISLENKIKNENNNNYKKTENLDSLFN